jgi:hypothetical protein
LHTDIGALLYALRTIRVRVKLTGLSPFDADQLFGTALCALGRERWIISSRHFNAVELALHAISTSRQG